MSKHRLVYPKYIQFYLPIKKLKQSDYKALVLLKNFYKAVSMAIGKFRLKRMKLGELKQHTAG